MCKMYFDICKIFLVLLSFKVTIGEVKLQNSQLRTNNRLLKNIRSVEAFKKNSRQYNYPPDEILDVLTKDNINHPASQIVLPIYERMLAGEHIINIIGDKKLSVKKTLANSDNNHKRTDVIRTVKPTSLLYSSGRKAKAVIHYNVSTTLLKNSIMISLHILGFTEDLCSFNQFKRLTIEAKLLNQYGVSISRLSKRLLYQRLCTKSIASTNPVIDLSGLFYQSGKISYRYQHSCFIEVSIYVNHRKSNNKYYRIIGKKIQLEKDQVVLRDFTKSATLLIFTQEYSSLLENSVTLNTQQNKAGKHLYMPILKGKDIFRFDLKQQKIKQPSLKRRKIHKIMRRVKRQKPNSKSLTSQNCQKEEFIVDFDTIGWSRWIVFPKAYNAFICHGRCPSPVQPSLNPSNHALLQSIMRIYERDIPRPCCSPTKLLPLSMLYYEDGELVVRQHENMIVQSCGCR